MRISGLAFGCGVNGFYHNNRHILKLIMSAILVIEISHTGNQKMTNLGYSQVTRQSVARGVRVISVGGRGTTQLMTLSLQYNGQRAFLFFWENIGIFMFPISHNLYVKRSFLTNIVLTSSAVALNLGAKVIWSIFSVQCQSF